MCVCVCLHLRLCLSVSVSVSVFIVSVFIVVSMSVSASVSVSSSVPVPVSCPTISQRKIRQSSHFTITRDTPAFSPYYVSMYIHSASYKYNHMHIYI